MSASKWKPSPAICSSSSTFNPAALATTNPAAAPGFFITFAYIVLALFKKGPRIEIRPGPVPPGLAAYPSHGPVLALAWPPMLGPWSAVPEALKTGRRIGKPAAFSAAFSAAPAAAGARQKPRPGAGLRGPWFAAPGLCSTKTGAPGVQLFNI